MKTVVVFKWLRNPQDARVGADGSVDWSAAKPAVSDDDPAAAIVAAALAADGECVGLTLGEGDLAWAAARGASRTVAVTDADLGGDAMTTAAVLAAAIRSIDAVDVVAIGDSPWDRSVPAALGGELGWRCLANVESASLEGGVVRVTRKVGDAVQVLDVKPPMVLAIAATRAEQHVPGMKEILVARKKPVAKTTVADLGTTTSTGVTSRGTRLPDTTAARLFDGADPAAAARDLVAALRSEGVL